MNLMYPLSKFNNNYSFTVLFDLFFLIFIKTIKYFKANLLELMETIVS